MPLGVLILDHFADRIRLLKTYRIDCRMQKIIDTREIAAKHTAYLSLPTLKRMAMPECRREGIDCQARFPQLELLLGSVPSSHSGASRGGTDGDHISAVATFHDPTPEDRD
jgi:hypothetical protein